MFRTVIWFIYFWLYLIACIPTNIRLYFLQRKGDMQKHDRIVDQFVRNWARRLVRLAGGKIEIKGAENLPEQAAVFISNHQGNFDVPIMLGFIGSTRGLIAKKELERIPLLRAWMRRLHCIFLDRSSPRAGAESIVQGAELLREGHGLTIFPEGTRSRGGEMKEFKAGALRIAVRAGAPVVPVTIDGSYKMMEVNKGVKITPAKVHVTIHPPIDTKALSREEVKALPGHVQAVIAGALKS